MSSKDVIDMLLELAGSQVLKADLKPEVNVIDENDILQEVELKVFEYFSSVENIGKLLHDKKQQIVIFNNLVVTSVNVKILTIFSSIISFVFFLIILPVES